MVFPVVGGDGKPTGYDIDNSLRFNDGDSPYLNRTFATPTNSKKFTFSAWYKRSTLSTTQYIISYDSGGLSMGIIGFSSTDKFIIYDRDSSSGSADIDYNTTQLFRDVSAWYHIVVSIDTTDGTAGDRVKIYVNGTRLTAFDTSTQPAQNYDTIMNSAVSHDIGRWQAGSSYYDGYMSEINYVDGQALDSSYFGETNDNGVWIPKEYDGTYGNSGFFLEFKQTGTSANSSGMGADTSGNDNHFSATNLAAIDVTVDTPTNNFCTLNPIAISRFDNDGVYSEGNTKITSTSSDNDRFYSVATMGVTSGKWYWEIKVPTASKVETGVGILTEIMGTSQHYNNETSPNIISVNAGGNIYGKGGADYDDYQNWAADLSDNDIIMWALDMDNYELWYGINGTWQDSGDPTSGATGTGGIINQTSNAYRTKLNHGDFIHPWVGDLATSGQTAYETNWGNPPFSISSGNADANGYGNFEYAVPSGFYSLCTKNLAEFG